MSFHTLAERDVIATGPAVNFFAPQSAIVCERGEKTLRLLPKYGRPIVARVRYIWHGTAGAPTVIMQGGISATRDAAGNADASGW